MQSEVVVEALSEGFKETAHRDARLVIHVLHEDVFRRLSAGQHSKRDEIRAKLLDEDPCVCSSVTHGRLLSMSSG